MDSPLRLMAVWCAPIEEEGLPSGEITPLFLFILFSDIGVTRQVHTSTVSQIHRRQYGEFTCKDK